MYRIFCTSCNWEFPELVTSEGTGAFSSSTCPQCNGDIYYGHSDIEPLTLRKSAYADDTGSTGYYIVGYMFFEEFDSFEQLQERCKQLSIKRYWKNNKENLFEHITEG